MLSNASRPCPIQLPAFGCLALNYPSLRPSAACFLLPLHSPAISFPSYFFTFAVLPVRERPGWFRSEGLIPRFKAVSLYLHHISTLPCHNIFFWPRSTLFYIPLLLSPYLCKLWSPFPRFFLSSVRLSSVHDLVCFGDSLILLLPPQSPNIHIHIASPVTRSC